MFVFYYSCSSERNVPCHLQQSSYPRAERSCTIAMLSFSAALNSDYGQTRKISFSLQFVLLPPERIWCTPASLLYKLSLQFTAVKGKTTVMSPLRLPELLGCHLDYREQEELLSQKLHLAPKAKDLEKERELVCPLFCSLTIVGVMLALLLQSWRSKIFLTLLLCLTLLWWETVLPFHVLGNYSAATLTLAQHA